MTILITLITYIEYDYNLFILISHDVFVKWLQQQQKTQDVETTSSSYATRRLKIVSTKGVSMGSLSTYLVLGVSIL